MNRNVKDKIDGWDIFLQRNINMYCHGLLVEKGNYRFSIDCEDLPSKEKAIGIWLCSIDAPEIILEELQSVLLQWVNKYEINIQIYTSKDEFITNYQASVASKELL